MLVECLLLIGSAVLGAQCLDTVYEWKHIDYLWDTPEQKQAYLQNGNYIHQAIIPIDVDKSRDGRIFVTYIREKGVPASLATVSDKIGPSGPLVKPYPDWSWHNKKDCTGITSVYRVIIDDCNKMYVLDNGYIGETRLCPAQVLLFNLSSNALLDKLVIPHHISHNAKDKGRLVTPIVEFSGPDCKMENLFIADPVGAGLVVWNTEKFVRLEGRAFAPDVSESKVTIAGEHFELPDSLIGITLSQKILPGDGKELYFRPFSSLALYGADTRVLARSLIADTIRFRENQDFLPSQASTMATAEKGSVFFGLTAEMAIGCWNQYHDMSRKNLDLVAQDGNRLQFISGMKVLPRSRTNGDEELWVLTNRFQKIMRSTMNYTEVNFRVLKARVNNLIKNSKCALSENFVGPEYDKIYKHPILKKTV